MEEHNDEHFRIVAATVKRLLEKFERLRPHYEPSKTSCLVPILSDSDHYNPRMVRIGPFGDQIGNYSKCRLLRSFLSNRGLCVEDCIRAIQSLKLDACQYYGGLPAANPENFTATFLFDGCFILELFFKWLGEEPDILFNEREGQIMILSDLLRVNCQIPLVVIETLYNLVMSVPGPTSITVDGSSGNNLAMAVQEPTSTRDAFLYLLVRFLMAEEPSHISPSPVQFPETIDNLLDLYHKFLLTTTSLCHDEKNHQTTASSLWKQRLTHSITLRLNQRVANRPPRQIPCATELYKVAGIKFKKKQSPKNFLDVTFSRGILEIPCLQVDNNLNALLANLVKLEESKFWEEQIITSYVVLMDSLIDTEGDVELLRHNGVIRNMLSSHHDAAIVFNKLGSSLSYDTVNHHFANLFKEVQLYYESKWNRSWARLMLDYLNNPWAIISVIAGVILLCLTMLQTFYTVFPYYHPH